MIHSRPREATRHGVGLEDGTRKVGHAQSNQFRGRIDFVLVLGGQGFGNGNRLHETHNHNGNCYHKHLVNALNREPLIHCDAGQTLGDATHNGNPSTFQIQRHGQQNAHGGYRQGPQSSHKLEARIRFPDIFHHHQEYDGKDSHDKGFPIEFGNVDKNVLQHFVESVRPFNVVPKNVLDLRHSDNNGRARGEAANHGVTQKNGDKAQAQQAHGNVGNTHQKRNLHGQLGVELIVGFRILFQRAGTHDTINSGGQEERNQRHGSDRQLPTATKHAVRVHWHEGRIQAKFHGQSGQLGVRHTLWNNHDAHRQTGNQILDKARLDVVGTNPFAHGQ
mmetsp:Transcript_15872/g.34809  ORF Transcript_15872/g.34809 Transcript_15872/m.34809 type:complete len:333 (+) Transcript_15872:510-1508(+)